MNFWTMTSWEFLPKRHSFGGLGPWAGHLPFANDLVRAVRPSLLVELGTFYGESYFGFCQTIDEARLTCNCYAVDTWRGDAHGGIYGEEIFTDVDSYNRAHYKWFSHLMRMAFDEAFGYFSDETIDILHIDGHHSYESIRSDFESWIRKVRPGGIVLMHDICIRTAGFGVWRFWEEVCERYPHFAFDHSAGLGVVVKPGKECTGGLICELLSSDREEWARISRYYAALAERNQLAFDHVQLANVRDAENASRTEAQELRAEARGLEKQIAELCDRLEAANRRCKDLEQSWSWRATAPARFLVSKTRLGRKR